MSDPAPVDHRAEAEKHASLAAEMLDSYDRSPLFKFIAAHQQQAFLHLELDKKTAS